MMKKFPKAKRQLEYVAVFKVQFKIKEGPVYAFFAVDAYSEFAFNLGVEPEDTPEALLKNIYFLMENPDFVKHMHKGFTLVFTEFEDLQERIQNIIAPVKGKLIYDRAFNRHIAYEFLRSLGEFDKFR
jgi:hypothetical protein